MQAISKYDMPFEVTQRQYSAVMREYAGCVAGREHDGRFYLKIWIMQYARAIRSLISET